MAGTALGLSLLQEAVGLAALAFLRALCQLDTQTWPTSQAVHGYSLSAGREHLEPRGGGTVRGGREDCRSTAPQAEVRRGDLLPATAHHPGCLGQFAKPPLGLRQSLQRRAERMAVEGHPPLLSPRFRRFRWNSSGTPPTPGCTRGHHLGTAAVDPNQGETAPTPTRQGS